MRGALRHGNDVDDNGLERTPQNVITVPLSDYFEHQDHEADRYLWRLREATVEGGDLSQLASALAEAFVADRCSRQVAEAWARRRAGGPAPPPEQREVLRAHIEPSFGLPDDEEAADEGNIPEYIQGAVAENLWYYLYQDTEVDTLVHLVAPDLDPTSGGADSLSVHRSEGGLSFRLWEIKKCTAERLPPTVARAYNQLSNHGTRYLAQMSLPGEYHEDDDVAELFGQLPTLWANHASEASAGVSIAIPTRLQPDDCFADFPDEFPELAGRSRLCGILNVVGDLTGFVRSVQEEVWRGL